MLIASMLNKDAWQIVRSRKTQAWQNGFPKLVVSQPDSSNKPPGITNRPIKKSAVAAETIKLHRVKN